MASVWLLLGIVLITRLLSYDQVTSPAPCFSEQLVVSRWQEAGVSIRMSVVSSSGQTQNPDSTLASNGVIQNT